MAEFLDKLYASLERVLNFPLFNLSDGPFRVSQLLTLLVFMVVVIMAERAFQRLILKRVLIRSRLQTSLQYAISRIIGYTIITFGCLVALQSVGLNLSSLTIFAGAIGVGVGFGLQNIVNNFISGLIILAERPIAVGDFIEMAGTGGRVREINLRSTTVVTNDNISIIVPNSDFISSTVTNYSHGDAPGAGQS